MCDCLIDNLILVLRVFTGAFITVLELLYPLYNGRWSGD